MDGTTAHFPPPQHESQLLDGHSVHVFPHTDPAFRDAVTAAIEGLTDGVHPTPQQVEAALRDAYPGVRVVEQVPLAVVGDALAIYVFRDGSIQAQAGDGPGTPRYIPLIVALQREAVRSLAVRQRSVLVVAHAVDALERSRAKRQARSAS